MDYPFPELFETHKFPTFVRFPSLYDSDSYGIDSTETQNGGKNIPLLATDCTVPMPMIFIPDIW